MTKLDLTTTTKSMVIGRLPRWQFCWHLFWHLCRHYIEVGFPSDSLKYPAEVTVTTEGDLIVDIPGLLQSHEAKLQVEALRGLEKIARYPTWAGRPPTSKERP